MIIDQTTIDTLMTWARIHAPTYMNGPLGDGFSPQRRRVRLEIAAERVHFPEWGGDGPGQSNPVIVARAYLAEPRCSPPQNCKDNDPCSFHCECSPLAETRIG
jgi:hypothetical protein